MDPSFLPGNTEEPIQGENGDHIAVGKYNLQPGAPHGGVVNPAPSPPPTRLRPRPSPVLVRPRPFPDLLDREAEVNGAIAALRSAQPVEFYGQPGLGKTVLLRYLAHHIPPTAFPDGIIYLPGPHQTAADLLQSLFENLYESEVRLKPTDTEIRHALQSKRALVLLDDVDLAQDWVKWLINAAPACTFLLASPERRLWGEGRAMALGGLPVDDAVALVERELGRPLSPEERPSAQSLCTALDGHPLRILQAAAMARAEGRSLAEVARQVQSAPSAGGLTAQLVQSLPKPERRVLAALAAVDGAPLHGEHLTALVGGAAAPALKTLLQRGLVQAHSPRYSLTGTLGQDLQQVWNLTPWAERALAYFTAWAERHRTAPGRLLEEADAILRTLEWAAGAGRWADVLRLGRAIEGALALGRRWGAWAQVLRWILQAARALGERSAEAWVLHQLGTRALCLDRAEQARSALSKALRMREALGDQAGAAVTRHNLNLLAAAPPAPPRKPPAPKAGPSTVQWLIPLVGIVTVVSFLVLVVMLILLQPRVNIWLEDGCDREYDPGDQTRLFVEANTTGTAVIWLDQEAFTEMSLPRGQTQGIFWTFGEEGSGEHQFRAVLINADGRELAEEVCGFALAPTPTPTPTPSTTPSPTPTPSTTPSPTPRVNIWLDDGCDREYTPGDETRILVEANVEGMAVIWWDQEALTEMSLTPGEVETMPWTFGEGGPGEHGFRAVLLDEYGEELASDHCDFRVEPAPPLIGDIWIEPFVPDIGPTPEPGTPVCPGDKVWVYVQVFDDSGLAKVEIRARYPAGSGSWTDLEMFYLDEQTYRHPLTAHESPGTEFYIYAEDVDGKWTPSDPQVYAVEPCATVPPPTPSITPSPTPDTQGPPAPTIVMPANDATLPCSQDVKLVWQAPSDPSGIANYRVRLQITPNYSDWTTVKVWDPVYATQVGANAETTCGRLYRWRVLARDGSDSQNQGQVSDWAYFGIAFE